MHLDATQLFFLTIAKKGKNEISSGGTCGHRSASHVRRRPNTRFLLEEDSIAPAYLEPKSETMYWWTGVWEVKNYVGLIRQQWKKNIKKIQKTKTGFRIATAPVWANIEPGSRTSSYTELWSGQSRQCRWSPDEGRCRQTGTDGPKTDTLPTVDRRINCVKHRLPEHLPSQPTSHSQ